MIDRYVDDASIDLSITSYPSSIAGRRPVTMREFAKDGMEQPRRSIDAGALEPGSTNLRVSTDVFNSSSPDAE